MTSDFRISKMSPDLTSSAHAQKFVFFFNVFNYREKKSCWYFKNDGKRKIHTESIYFKEKLELRIIIKYLIYSVKVRKKSS